MFGFAIFCIQVFFIQNAFSQTVMGPSNINNGIPPSFGPGLVSGMSAASLAASNMNTGLTGQMISNGVPGAAFNQIGAQPHGKAPGQMGIAPGQMGMAPGQLGMAPGQMGMAPGQMGMAPGQMGMAPGQMGMAPGQMGMAPGQMGMAPGQMGIAPGQISIANGQMGLTPNQMSMAAAQMGLTPGQTGVAPGQKGVPMGITSNKLAAGLGPNYGGSGSGDVAVAGELPVAGTTSITGQVPMSGKVAFTGTLPAGGVVTISGQCGGVSNPAQLSTSYGTKPGYNNKSYLH